MYETSIAYASLIPRPSSPRRGLVLTVCAYASVQNSEYQASPFGEGPGYEAMNVHANLQGVHTQLQYCHFKLIQ